MSRFTFKITVEPNVDHPFDYSVIAHGVRGTSTFVERIGVQVAANATPQQEADLVAEAIGTISLRAIRSARELLDRVPGRESASGDAHDRCLSCNEQRDRHLGKQHPFEVAS